MTYLPRAAGLARWRGAAMVEFTVVAPLITMLGLLVLQWALVTNARQQIDHATFMAARAGSSDHANLQSMQAAWVRNLVPLYGGGLDSAALAQARQRAAIDSERHSRLRVLNPSRESFDDWHDSRLSARYGRRAIPNGQLAFKPATAPGPRSAQTLHEANLLKLWVTHGYPLQVPLAGRLVGFLLRWADDGQDAFYTALLANGRLPLHSHVVLHMQSDPLEPAWPASAPGGGPQDGPTEPQGGPAERPVPNCVSAGCTVIVSPWPAPGSAAPPLLDCPPDAVDCAPLCSASATFSP